MSGSANANDGLLISGGADDDLIIGSHRDHLRRMAQWQDSTVNREKCPKLKAWGGQELSPWLGEEEIHA